MEMKVSSGSGEAVRGASSSVSKKRPPSRLQKQAPASLQLEQGAAAGAGGAPGAGAWGDGRAAIPLLSPLVTTPTMPVWEADQAGTAMREGGADQAEGKSAGEQQQQQHHRGAARHGGGSGERQAHDASPRPPAPAPAAAGGGWRHPALATPVGEPASLVSFFQSQCAVEVRNAQQ